MTKILNLRTGEFEKFLNTKMIMGYYTIIHEDGLLSYLPIDSLIFFLTFNRYAKENYCIEEFEIIYD